MTSKQPAWASDRLDDIELTRAPPSWHMASSTTEALQIDHPLEDTDGNIDQGDLRSAEKGTGQS